MFSLTQQVHSYSSLLVGMSYKLLAQERGLEQGRRRYMCDLPDSPEKMGFLAKERSEKAWKGSLVKGGERNMLEFLMEILCSTRLNLEYLSIILHLFFKYIFKTLVIGESREYLGHVLCIFSVGSGLGISTKSLGNVKSPKVGTWSASMALNPWMPGKPSPGWKTWGPLWSKDDYPPGKLT